MRLYDQFLKEIPGSSDISANVEKLREQKDRLIHELAFLQATVDCDDQKKLGESYSGRIASEFPLWAARLLVMGVTRCFDKKPPRIIGTLDLILKNRRKIVDVRRKTHPNWTDEQLGILQLEERIEKTLSKANSLYASQDFAEIRVFRSEELAHSLDSLSRDRTTFGFSGNLAQPKFRTIMQASEQTILLIDSIISFWEFKIENSQDTLALYKAYAQTYWKALPNFEDVEDLSIVSNANKF